MATMYLDTGTATWSNWTTVTVTTTATTTDTWVQWTASTTATDTCTTTGTVTWTQWVTLPNDQLTYSTGTGYRPSEAEIAAERERLRVASDTRQREREEAARKAKALLHSMLDVKQREQLERDRFFDFVSQTGRRMRIKAHSYSRNIDELGPDGRRLRTLCAHPSRYDLPLEDHLTAQLLALRHNEEEFLRHANVS